MENKEEVLQALEEFSRKPADKVPALLEEYLNSIALTGETLFPWAKLKPLFLAKLDQVMSEFFQFCPTDGQIPCPNVENVKFDEMRQRLLDYINLFNGAPFTIQRLCELLINPRKHYRRTDKFLRGIEKNVMVVSTVDPFGKKIVSETKTMVNGLESNGHQGDSRGNNDNDNKSTDMSTSPSSISNWFNSSMATTWSSASHITDNDGPASNRDQENNITTETHDFHCEADGDSSTSSESESPLSSENEEGMDTMETATGEAAEQVVAEQMVTEGDGNQVPVDTPDDSANEQAAEPGTEQAKDPFISSSDTDDLVGSLSSTEPPSLVDSTSNQSESHDSFTAVQSPERVSSASPVPLSEHVAPETEQNQETEQSPVTDSTVTNITDTVTDTNVTDTDVTDTGVTSSQENMTPEDSTEQCDILSTTDTSPDLGCVEKLTDWSEVTSSDQESAQAHSECDDRTKLGHEQDTETAASALHTEESGEGECVTQSVTSEAQSVSNSDTDTTACVSSDSKETSPDVAECSSAIEDEDNVAECSSAIEDDKEAEAREKAVTTVSAASECESESQRTESHSEQDSLTDHSNHQESNHKQSTAAPQSTAVLQSTDCSTDEQTVTETAAESSSNTQPNEEPMDMN